MSQNTKQFPATRGKVAMETRLVRHPHSNITSTETLKICLGPATEQAKRATPCFAFQLEKPFERGTRNSPGLSRHFEE